MQRIFGNSCDLKILHLSNSSRHGAYETVVLDFRVLISVSLYRCWGHATNTGAGHPTRLSGREKHSREYHVAGHLGQSLIPQVEEQQ